MQNIARADVLYANLDTSTWATVGDTIEYEYDANGSLIRKTTWDGEINTGTKTQEILYSYNLQNRLAQVRTDDTPLVTTDWEDVVYYEYNDSGIRVAQYEYEATFDGNGDITAIRDDGSQQEKTVLYLIDPANHTGYAQTIAELTYDDKTDPDPATDTPDSIRSYTIGDDVLAQSDNPGTAADTEYLLYDGHGSTRQLTDNDIDGTDDIIDSYSYDAYGTMLGGNPTAGSPAATNLLYSGEQYDNDLNQYYLRARYYNQNNGTFNRVDPYSGNTHDPQSLHKYTYCHANPINGIDPSGMMSFSIPRVMVAIAIMAILFSANIANAPGPGDLTYRDRSGAMMLDLGFAIVTVGVCSFAGRFIVAPLAAKLRGFGKIFQGRAKLPPRLARVVPADVTPTHLGVSKATDVFVTSVDDIARITNADDLASRLTLLDDSGNLMKGPFRIIEFDNPIDNLASPVFRTNPGFIEGPFTQGGAVEYVLPNYELTQLTNVNMSKVLK